MHINSNLFIATCASTILLSAPLSAAERSFEFDNIQHIVASAGVHVLIQKGDTQSVLVEAKEEWDFDHLKLDYEAGTLNASQEYGFWDFALRGSLIQAFFRNDHRITINLTVPEITSLTANSGAEISLTSFSGTNLSVFASSGGSVAVKDITFDEMNLTASSGGEIDAQGTCILSNVNSSSGADISASALTCQTTSTHASSGGRAEVYATNSATANASSGGSVDVYGTPAETNVNQTSGGSVDIDG